MSDQSTAPAPIERVREKHFNTAGPNITRLHYELDPLIRIDSDAIEELIEQQRYFVLHAPRQTGKTSFLVIFDQRAKPAKWEKRMQSSEAKTESGRQIWVLRG